MLHAKIKGMLLEKIEAKCFRNLKGNITFGEKLNILFGENGHGKTNWLEAIYLLSTTKSFKTARLNESINFNETIALICGHVQLGSEIQRRLCIELTNNIKKISVNNKSEALKNYLGQLHTIVFDSTELEIVRGQPESRRKFLDGGIVSLHPPFLRTFSDYNKVIRQKNTLLSTAKSNEYSLEQTSELLLPWNQQLLSLAQRIHRARVRLVDRLNEALQKKLFGREEVAIRYLSSLEGKGDLNDYENLLAERLNLRVQAELAAGHSLIGPHRDDLEILFDGRDLRKYGSAGQQRSALLILLLAGLSVYHSTRNEYPLFLLDDIDAELDYKRIGLLLEYLEDKTQTFATTSKRNFVESFGGNAAKFLINEGSASLF